MRILSNESKILRATAVILSSVHLYTSSSFLFSIRYVTTVCCRFITVRKLENKQDKQSNLDLTPKLKPILKDDAEIVKDEGVYPDETKIGTFLNSSTSLNDEPIINGHKVFQDGFLLKMVLFFGICLLILHTFLCYKLYSIDQVFLTQNITCLSQCQVGLLFD